MEQKCEEHSGCKNQIETNKDNIGTLFEVVDKIRNRPPVWVTLLLMALLGVIGWLAKGA